MESTVHLLPYELFVATIPKDGVSGITHSLLRLLLRLFSGDQHSRRNNFFSFSDTSTDYSLILDKELLEVLRSHGCGDRIRVAEGKWRPLVVEVGALGSVTGVSKIAASVIAPLADHNVSVYCVSTNQEDYVLVREQELHKALRCLSDVFRIMCDSQTQHDQALVEAVSSKTIHPRPTSQLKSIIHPCDPVHRPIVHPYVCSKSSFNICSIVPQALPSVGMILLDLMLYSKRSAVDGSFFSLSVIDDDISMVIDSRDLDRFPEGSLYHTEGSWKLLRIGDGPLGFDECGIVAQVSTPLAHAEISTYYICTFFADHTLLFNVNDWMRAIHLVQGHMLPESSIGKALRLLQERLSSRICGLTTSGIHVECNGVAASGMESDLVDMRVNHEPELVFLLDILMLTVLHYIFMKKGNSLTFCLARDREQVSNYPALSSRAGFTSS